MPFELTRNRIIIIAIAAVVILGTLGLFSCVIPGMTFCGNSNLRTGTLTVWGAYDSRQVWEEIITAYQKLRPNVKIVYEEKNAETYETDLINALAAGRGPDIFMFHNTWLPKHIDKITPANEAWLKYIDYRDRFPQVVLQDFAPEGTIYAAPLYIDTLAMFYNKDLFDKKGIATVPQTWTQFQSVVNRIKEINPSTGAVIRPGAAIGGSSRSINRATDLISLLMLQTGAQMVDPTYGQATFASYGTSDFTPGLAAFTFYTDFANPSKPARYTWNDSMHYSIDSFAEDGGVGIIFNYSHQIAALRAKNRFLNFGVAPMPQPANAAGQPVAYANYWGLAVSNKLSTDRAFWAWDFVQFTSMNEIAAQIYSQLTQKPPALRTLLSRIESDADYGVFAKQALIARSWPQADNVRIEQYFSEMVQAVLSNELTPEAALKRAEDQVSLLMGH